MSIALAFLLAQAAAAQAPSEHAAVPETPPPATEATPLTEPAQLPNALGLQQGGDIVVTARRRSESVQDVPIAMSVIGGTTLAETGVYNVGRLTQIQPSLQFYSTNPRNSAANIRGLGAPFGLTNDGIEQGVGIYVDRRLLQPHRVRDVRFHRYRADRDPARAARAHSTARTRPRARSTSRRANPASIPRRGSRSLAVPSNSSRSRDRPRAR